MKSKNIHFIGIGGIGMSGIAKMCLSMGCAVQGTDIKRTLILDDLESLGARILIGHESSYVDGADLVVYSSSIGADHPERVAALEKGIRIIHRSEALAQVCRDKYTIAVTGTHGKTTTTALVGLILKEAGRDPSIVVGGLVNLFGGNACCGKGREIVIEADESDASFLNFSPDLEVITNIEAEHMDHYETFDKVESAYRNFLKRMPETGEWFGCAEDPRIVRIASEKIRRATLYGFDKSVSEICATDIEECPDGKRGIAFRVWSGGKDLGRFEMKILGRHNVLNALAALGVGLKLGVDLEVMKMALGKYGGAARRFDVKYEDSEFLIVDDYAHHPTEIQKTLEAARALGKSRIIALFQPHRYSRTESFMEDFGASFACANRLFVTDIYAAGERPRPGITGQSVFESIKKAGHEGAIFVSREELVQKVRSMMEPGDLVIAMGAGDITQAASDLSQRLREGLFRGVRGKVLLNEPLSKHTTLRVGGAVEFWTEPEDADDLKKILEICFSKKLKATIFGSGSNVLPPDEGLKGIVIHLGAGYFKKVWRDGDRLIARAGAPNTLFIQFALESGFGGYEFLLGIPGCVGGSLAMNAGSHKQSIDTYLEEIKVMDFFGQEKVLKREEVPFKYRSSGLANCIIMEAVFSLPLRAREETQKKLDEYRDYRMRTQDLKHPSAGCMFKNPKDNACSAGKLIEDAGLKGRRVGRAQVSDIHANFIINLGGATSGDVLSLMTEVKEAVKKKFEVELEAEVKVLA